MKLEDLVVGETYVYEGRPVVYMWRTSGEAAVGWADGVGGLFVDPALMKPLPTRFDRFTRCLGE